MYILDPIRFPVNQRNIAVVYVVYCTEDDCYYIGSTFEPSIRFRRHASDLLNKGHGNKNLQRVFNVFFNNSNPINNHSIRISIFRFLKKGFDSTCEKLVSSLQCFESLHFYNAQGQGPPGKNPKFTIF